MDKLFTVILNIGLDTFLEVNSIPKESQCGCASYSTSDNIFVIHALIEYLKRVRK